VIKVGDNASAGRREPGIVSSVLSEEIVRYHQRLVIVGPLEDEDVGRDASRRPHDATALDVTVEQHAVLWGQFMTQPGVDNDPQSGRGTLSKELGNLSDRNLEPRERGFPIGRVREVAAVDDHVLHN